MLIKEIKKKVFSVGVLVLFLISTMTSILQIQMGSAEEQNPNEIHLNHYFSEPWITQKTVNNTTYDFAILNNSQSICVSGEPCIPIKPVSVLLPQCREIQSMTVEYEGNISLGENYNLQLGTNFVQLERIEPQPQNQNYNDLVSYPTTIYRNCDIQCFRGYSILTFTLFPLHYIGYTGEIYYYQWMNVTITTTPTGSINPLFRNLPEDQNEIKSLVDDYSCLNTYETIPENPLPSYLVDPTKIYKYVIITNSSLVNLQEDYTFEDLANYKNARGITTTIVTVGDIYQAYSGVDNQEKIRNFIRDAYLYWDTNYVLLGGDNATNNGDEIVPARLLWVDILDHGEPPQVTDSANIPSDLYYACLDGCYDYNSDNKWGQPTDGENGGDVDLVAEINVGRACVSNPTEVSNFVMKTLAYENTDDSYLNDILMVGMKTGFGDEAEWGGNFKNQMIDGSDCGDCITIGIPSDEYTINTLYDKDYQPNGWINHYLLIK